MPLKKREPKTRAAFGFEGDNGTETETIYVTKEKRKNQRKRLRLAPEDEPVAEPIVEMP